MKNILLFLALALPTVLCAQFTPSPAINGLIYGITGSLDGGNIVTINPSTGATTLVSNLEEYGTGINYQGIQGLAISPAGEMYGGTTSFNNSGGSNPTRAFMRISASNGEAQIISSLDPYGANAMEFDANGTLWACGEQAGGAELYQIDPTSGAITLINTLAVGPFWTGMALNPVDGRLYVWNHTANAIWEINISDGSSTFVSSSDLGGGLVRAGDIFFSASGELYLTGGGQSPGLYQMDLNTGTTTLVGPWSFPGGMSSAAFANVTVPVPVPTMSQWGFILLVLSVLSFGVVSIKQRKISFAGVPKYEFSIRNIPFNRSAYIRILLLVAIIVLTMFTIGIQLFGYELTSADIPGSLLSIPLAAYCLHLVFGD